MWRKSARIFSTIVRAVAGIFMAANSFLHVLIVALIFIVETLLFTARVFVALMVGQHPTGAGTEGDRQS